MRFMVIVKANKQSEAGVLPTEEELSVMGKFNEELVKAGIMLAGDGLHPSSRGARIKFPERQVVDGPFTETKELIAGFWIWQVKSLEEAIEWARRAPCFQASTNYEGELEIRQIFEFTDFDISNELRDRFAQQEAALKAQK